MVNAVLDSSVLIKLLDRGDVDLLEELVSRYDRLYIPWISLYEYLYGHAVLGRSIEERKKALEALGTILWVTQEILTKALEVDIELRKRGEPIPFSDVLIAASALQKGCELVTLDTRHFSKVEGLRVVVP